MFTLKRFFIFALMIAGLAGASAACSKTDDTAAAQPEVMARIKTNCGSSTCI